MLFLVAWIFNFLDRIIYFWMSLLCNSKKKAPESPKSVEIECEAVKGETKPRVRGYMKGKDLVTTPFPGCDTLPLLWMNSVKSYSSKNCMAKRELKKMHKKTVTLHDGKVKEWYTPEFGPVEFESYEEVNTRVINFGNGLRNLGVEAGEKLGIFENTRPKWMIGAQACFRNSIVVVTVYSNLGEDALFHSINQTKMSAILCNASSVDRLLDAGDLLPSLECIIFTDEYASKKERKSKVKVISFKDVEDLGKQSENSSPHLPKSSDLALVMYTSGATGLPKGVSVSHANFCAAIGALSLCLGDLSKDTHLAYLPLAHIFELAVELGVLSLGGVIGYGSPRTLTDATAKPFGDLKAFKPTLFIAVPRVYDTIRKAALEKINHAGGLTKYLYEAAYDAKLNAIKHGRDTPLWNSLVFNNFKSNLGGRVGRCISGGAPLSAETQEFVRVAFSCSISQGFGLTETVAGGSVEDLNDLGLHTLSVGAPVPCCMIKLVDVPEMNYLSIDQPPRGEVWIKGGNVTMGYYNDEKLTSEAFTKDGWFKTGDIGCWLPDGTLKIFDRKKNLIKLSKGEYVALEALEAVYSGSPFVAPNGICVYGDSFQSFLVALIIPQESYLKSWAHVNGISGTFPELCKNPTVIKAVVESLMSETMKNKKNKVEEIRDLRLYADEWTPENGLLTAAQKLKRSEIVKRYDADIKQMYNSKDHKL